MVIYFQKIGQEFIITDNVGILDRCPMEEWYRANIPHELWPPVQRIHDICEGVYQACKAKREVKE